MQNVSDRVRPAVKIVRLTRRFGALTAVDGLDLEIPSRGIFGFLGSNEAGKTTVMKMLTTLFAPTAEMAKVSGSAASDSANHAASVRSAVSRRAHHWSQSSRAPGGMAADTQFGR
ncbi:MAG: ATP-binding cassette domain-containing protein [Burkholderiales bacterium]